MRHWLAPEDQSEARAAIEDSGRASQRACPDPLTEARTGCFVAKLTVWVWLTKEGGTDALLPSTGHLLTLEPGQPLSTQAEAQQTSLGERIVD